MGTAVVLFTRDLRVHDHPALVCAAREHDAVAPVFVLDREILTGSAATPNRVAFLLDCLRDLDASLRERGAHLIVRRGDVVGEALAVARAISAEAIHMSRDITPYARTRAERLAEACAGAGLALHEHAGITAVPAGSLTPTGGDHYRVFTPYWRAWSACPIGPPLRAPRRLAPAHGKVGGLRGLPSAARLARGKPSPGLARGGEAQARAQLARWVRSGLHSYDERHDDIAGAATSGLSAHLHFGCVSPRTLLARSDRHDPGGAFARQLCWRDFHHQVLAARPDMPRRDYRSRGRRWRHDEHAAQAWREGRTGIPIVDAGMRQLAGEGFMHNRARLVVASFLTKTLRIDWRTGAAHFASLLVDADVANNVGNWQWVAGTGNDTRPNRVLNPLRQAMRFDPDGDYVRRWVPELAEIGGRAVHEPWALPSEVRRGLVYPAPLVAPPGSR